MLKKITKITKIKNEKRKIRFGSKEFKKIKNFKNLCAHNGKCNKEIDKVPIVRFYGKYFLKHFLPQIT